MTSRDTPKTILLRGDPLGGEGVAEAGADIKPGFLIERDSSTGQLQPHSVVGGTAAAMFAREADFAGGSIEDTYEDGDQVVYWNARKGDHVYAFLAYGEDVAIGAYLQSDGNGALEEADTDGFPVAIAVEAVDNQLGGAASRIKVEVL